MIPITEYPSFVREMKGYLQTAFGNWRQVENAMRYLSGLIVLPERKNVSSMNRSFTDYRNQASMNNFITDSTWSDDEFHRAAIQVVKDEIAKQGIKHGKLVIDDTLLEKSGEEMEGVGWYWDNSQGRHVLAHNLVSSHYVTGMFHVPLDFEVYVRRTDCEEKKKFRTKVEIAKELVEKAAGYGLPIDVVVFDSWYMSEELTSFLLEKGIGAYVSEEKGDRIVLSDDSRTEMSLTEFAKTIQAEKFEPVEVYTSLLGEKRTFMAHCTSVRMKHLDGKKVRLVISYRDDDDDDHDKKKEPSFYVSNVRIWEAKRILQTYAMRWSIEGFHRDSKQSLGLDEYQVRKIRGVKRHIAMVFFAYVVMQLGPGLGSVIGNLKANLRTVGSRCRLAYAEVLRSLVTFVLKMARKDASAAKIFDLLTKPLARSGYWS